MKYLTNTKFYVFYDKNDFVTSFGTSADLVKDGYFSSKAAVKCRASKIKKGKVKGNVVVLPLVD